MAPERSSTLAGNQLRNSSTMFSSTSGLPTQYNSPMIQQGNPPPVPPRQPTTNYSGYNDYYRPFGSNYYGGYGGYSGQYRGYSGYGGFYSNAPGYNNYGAIGAHSGDVESRFLQYAEESTRSTFQLVETVLQTFSSLTMLLESTYFAMTNSFRAILSVAENIGRLRNTIGQLLSTFALIRYLKWMYRKILHASGHQDQASLEEELWDRTLGRNRDGNSSTPSTLSGILIFSIFVVVPYVIHKIMNNVKQMQTKGTDPREWHKSDEPVYTANVLYDFIAATPEELTVRAGQKIWLAPHSLQPKNLPGWCRATDNTSVGLVPCNHIAVVGQLRRKTTTTPTATTTNTTTSQPVLDIVETKHEANVDNANTKQEVTKSSRECDTDERSVAKD